MRVGEQTQITNVLWQCVNPEWEEALFFREICAASELVVEVSSVKPIYRPSLLNLKQSRVRTAPSLSLDRTFTQGICI